MVGSCGSPLPFQWLTMEIWAASMALPEIIFLGMGPSGSRDGIIVGLGVDNVTKGSFLFLFAL
eukprot:10963327-Karenia_brevis.AAC.1